MEKMTEVTTESFVRYIPTYFSSFSRRVKFLKNNFQTLLNRECNKFSASMSRGTCREINDREEPQVCCAL